MLKSPPISSLLGIFADFWGKNWHKKTSLPNFKWQTCFFILVLLF